jgi:Co/Zn/Cd efflux system component
LGVIVAGVLVLVLNSNKPDLIIGSIVFILVMRGALKILSLGK